MKNDCPGLVRHEARMQVKAVVLIVCIMLPGYS